MLKFKVRCNVCNNKFLPRQDANMYQCPRCKASIPLYKEPIRELSKYELAF